MKVLQQKNWDYTLYELNDGRYLLKVMMPSKNNAWACYEQDFLLGMAEKYLIKLGFLNIDSLVQKLKSTRNTQ